MTMALTRLARAVATWEGFLGILTIGVLAYAGLRLETFATSFNISQAIAGSAERAMIVLPMSLLIIAREIDISVASIMALSSVVFGVCIQAGGGLLPSMAAALLCGLACGAFNGGLVTWLGLPSLVVTLGTLAMFRGIGYVILGSASVNIFPESFTDFGIDTVFNTPLPWTIVPFLVLAPLFAIVLHATPLGRRIYAIGGNPETALYSGVNVSRIRFGLFVTSGLISALAGIVFTARLANARANNALGLEFDVITVALLGGISIFGGRGKLTGVFWALVLIATLRNVLGLSQIGGDAQGVMIGLLLIGSLLASNLAEGSWSTLAAARLRPAGPASGSRTGASDKAPKISNQGDPA